MLTPTGEIRRDEGCLDYAGGVEDINKDDTVIVLQCHGSKENQYWIYNEVCLIFFAAKLPVSQLFVVFLEQSIVSSTFEFMYDVIGG
jgi:hypothetical protein